MTFSYLYRTSPSFKVSVEPSDGLAPGIFGCVRMVYIPFVVKETVPSSRVRMEFINLFAPHQLCFYFFNIVWGMALVFFAKDA